MPPLLVVPHGGQLSNGWLGSAHFRTDRLDGPERLLRRLTPPPS